MQRTGKSEQKPPLLPFRHLWGAGGSTGTIVPSGHNPALGMTVPAILQVTLTISGTVFWMLAAGSSWGSIVGCRCFPYLLKDNDTFADATGNRFSIRAVMATSGGTAAGSGTGTAGPGATLVFAAPGLMIVFVGLKSGNNFS